MNIMPDFAFDVNDTFERAVKSDLLTKTQLWGVVLASAYATREKELITKIEEMTADRLDQAYKSAAKMAASVMSMNNVYWRFWHLVDDKDYLQIESGLAQESFKKHGINNEDFEIMCLAVSVINICSGCLRVHSRNLIKEGFSKEQIMHIIRLTATVHGMATSLSAR